MANILDGTDFKDLGLLVNSYENMLNMPSRIGSVFYNWGDDIQPLVQEEDIFWNVNTIKINCVFDTRLGASLEQTLADLRAMTEPVQLETDYGVYTVTVLEVEKVTDRQTGVHTLTLVFEHDVTDFVSLPALPANPSGGTSFKIAETVDSTDVYDFYRHFGILVTRTEFFNDVPELEKLRSTRFKTPVKRSRTRKWGKVRVHCTLPFEKTNVNYLRKLLSTPELKKIYYGGFSYDGFLSRGFEVKHQRDSVEFILELNISVRDPILQVFGNGIFIPPNDTSPSLADGTNFGLIDIVGQSETQQFELRNVSSNQLSGVSAEVTGTGFELASLPNAFIPGNSSVYFSVRCDPDVLGPHFGIVKVFSSDALYSPYIFHVSCSTWDSSLVGALEVRGNGVLIPASGHSANSTDGTAFGDVEQYTRKDLTLLLTNAGTKRLEFVSAVLSNGNTDIKLEGTLPGGLNIGSSVNFNVGYVGTVLGGSADTLTITWKNGRDAGNITHQINFSGNTVENIPYPNIQVFYQGTEIPYNAAASTAYGTLFPERVIFSEAVLRDFEVINNDNLNIVDITTTSQNFITPDKGTLPVAPGATNPFEMGFLPTVAGDPLTGELQIKTNTKTWRCALRGSAVNEAPVTKMRLMFDIREIPLIGNFPNSLNGTDFGYYQTGGGAGQVYHTFTIENIGNQAFDVPANGVSLLGTPGFSISDNTDAVTLQPGDFTNFTVTFSGGGLVDAPVYDRMIYSSGGLYFNVQIKAWEVSDINL